MSPAASFIGFLRRARCRRLVVALAGAALAACARENPEEPRTVPLPVQILADTGSRIRLDAPPPDARIWMAKVRVATEPRTAVAPAAPAGPGPTLPGVADSVIAPPEAPVLEIDADLEPPILRRSARLVVPDRWRGHRGARASVELDLLIDESGGVTQVEWAGGSEDSTLVEAATRSAHEMSFLPALRRGHPVAVWSRQRFDFGKRR